MHNEEINQLDQHSFAPIHYVALETDTCLTTKRREILKNLNDELKTYPAGTHPLVLAIKTRNYYALEYLLSAGALVNELDKQGYALIHYAAEQNDSQSIHILLQHGANPNLLLGQSPKSSPLHLLAKNKHDCEPQSVANLLHAGADPLATDANGKSAIECALDEVNHFFIKALLTPTSYPSKHVPRPYIAAVINGMTDKHWTFLTTMSYPVIDLKTSELMFRALKNEYNKLAECIIPSYLTNSQDGDGMTALHVAAEFNNLPIIRGLLAHRYPANVKLCTSKGFAPLHIAAMHGHTQIVEELLKHYPLANDTRPEDSPNINQTNQDGATPLLLAAKYANEEKNNKANFEMLLNKGADHNIADNEGKSVVGYLTEQYKLGRITLSTYRELCALIAFSNINFQDAQGQTALVMAIRHNHVKLALELIEKQACIDLCTNRGFTPLHIAVLYGYEEIIQTLLKHYPHAKQNSNKELRDINKPNGEGATSLILAGKHAGPNKNNKAIFEMLLEKGADPTIQDNAGKTVVDYLKEQYESRLISQENYRELRSLVAYPVSCQRLDAFIKTCETQKKDLFSFFSYSPEQKKAAAVALKTVIQGQAPLASLKIYSNVFKQADLKEIYDDIYPMLAQRIQRIDAQDDTNDAPHPIHPLSSLNIDYP